MSHIQTVVDRLAPHGMDCGDNSCRFAIVKGGMRTNGGCRCLDKRSLVHASNAERFAISAAQLIRELLQELEKYESKTRTKNETE